MFLRKKSSLQEIKNEEQWQRHAAARADGPVFDQMVAKLGAMEIDSPAYREQRAAIDRFQNVAKLDLTSAYWRTFRLGAALFLWLPGLCAAAAAIFNLVPMPGLIANHGPGSLHLGTDFPMEVAGVATALCAAVFAARLLGKLSQVLVGICLLTAAAMCGFASLVSQTGTSQEIHAWAALSLLCAAVGALLFAFGHSWGSVFTSRDVRGFKDGDFATAFPARVGRRWSLGAAAALAICALSWIAAIPGVMAAPSPHAASLASAAPREADALAAADEILALVKGSIVGARYVDDVYLGLADPASRGDAVERGWVKRDPKGFVQSAPRIQAILARHRLSKNSVVFLGSDPDNQESAETCPAVLVVPKIQATDVTQEIRTQAQGDTMKIVFAALKHSDLGYARISFGSCKTGLSLVKAMKDGRVGFFDRRQTEADAAKLTVEIVR